MFKNGVVIGKFYPPHRGHKYLIDTATNQCEKVTVFVCGKPEQTIPGELRAKWLQEIHPTVEVRLIDDIYPDDDSELWAKNTIEWLGYVPDAAFTSEEYGESWSYFMGCQHVQVDKPRLTVPVSGTAVRNDPFGNWEFLEPVVRAYFAKRICVVGAESTGTTTMAQALAEHYQTVWVPEFGREYAEEKMSRPDPGEWVTEEFVHIASRQNELEDAALREANKLLICDTNAFATCLWHYRYLGFRAPEVEAVAAPRPYDLYLLTNADIPFVQDGTRDGEHIRHEMHRWFVDALEAQTVPWLLLSGSHEERLTTATSMIDRMFFRKLSVSSCQ